MKLIDNMKNWKHDLVKNCKYYLIAPIAIIVLGLIMFFVQGVNLGIDFTGGTAVSVQFGEEISNQKIYDERVNEIEDVMAEFGLKLALDQRMGEGASTKIQVRYQDIPGKSSEEMATITEDFVKALEEKYVDFKVTNDNRISASASASLLLNALLAVSIAVVLIVIYLALRFKQVLFGLCSIISLLHDVFIMIAFMLIFNLEISSTFIAALITIIGYSINNNIVVFDRIRENLKLMPGASISDITNVSIKQSLTRTIITTLTTFVIIFGLLFIGISGITTFVLPITIGLVASVYSVIFVASPLWAVMNKKKINKD